jgi:hypothetical protein
VSSSTRLVSKSSWRNRRSSNAALDLDKHEAQVVAEENDPEKAVPASFATRVLGETRGAEMAT